MRKNNIQTSLIKKLRLKKGCKYILFFPKSAGISKEEIERIDFRYVDLSFLVKSTKGIKVIEHEMSKLSKKKSDNR